MFGFKRYNVQEHINRLLLMYKSLLDEYAIDEEFGVSHQFMTVVLTNAIHALENGVKPKKVENWVVKLEKTFIFGLGKDFV